MSDFEKRMAAFGRGEAKPAPLQFQMAKGGTLVVRLYDWVGESYGGVTAKSFAAELDKNPGAKELEVHINSNGGSASDGVAIFNIVSSFKGPKRTVADGTAASAASVIFMAGDQRVMMPGSQLMVHGARSMAAGTADDFETMAAELRQLNESIAPIYAQRSGQSMEQVRAWMSKDNYFNPTEAVQAGLATAVADAQMALGERTSPDRPGLRYSDRVALALLTSERGTARR